MYTLAKVAEPWAKLFPKIKESATSIEVTVRGQSFKIEILKKANLVTGSRNLQYR
jgi:hypothetical protein